MLAPELPQPLLAAKGGGGELNSDVMKNILQHVVLFIALLFTVNQLASAQDVLEYVSTSPTDGTVIPTSGRYAPQSFDITFGENVTIVNANPDVHLYHGDAATGVEIEPDNEWNATMGDNPTDLRVWGADYDGYTCAFLVDESATYTLVIPAGVVKNAAGLLNGEITLTFYGSEDAIPGGNEPGGETLSADFTADEAYTTYYTQGWDSQTEADTWTYTITNPNYTWQVSNNVPFDNQKPFSSIESDSKSSLYIKYSTSEAQNETATSPEITIEPDSKVEFQSLFCGVWLVYADWTFSVTDVATGETQQLLSAFQWAQENAFTGPSWVKFSYNLSDFSGKTCKFAFNYSGTNGDYVLIDGFKIKKKSGDGAFITINEGESVHFADTSTGTPTAWAWTFNGAATASSTEQNPTVTYPTAGTYDVTLTVANDNSTSTETKAGFVVVKVSAPAAHIGLPAAGYYSPWVASFIPTDVPVQFTDASTGNPTSWNWTFDGATPAASTEQNPTVFYSEKGIYGLTLDVANTVGTSHDFMVNAIQAGGKQDAWNISPDEVGNIASVSLGWYGNYAGTNWLGMEKFAEKFGKPLAKATLDTVSIYFDKVTAISTNASITVEICKVNAEGNPGDVMTTTSLSVTELAYDAQNVVATHFPLSEPIEIEEEFFVVVGGFPNVSDADGSDDIAMLCLPRGKNGATTTWHLLEDYDDNYQPLGTYTWFKNVDEPLSLVLTAKLNYDSEQTAISNATNNSELTVTGVYTTGGMKLNTPQRGINIVTYSNGSVRKIMIK